MKRSIFNALFFLALGAGLLFLLWLRLHQPPNLSDDAYITYRYARNLAAGLGFVYNIGDRVMGTTTPAYTVLLAFASRLSQWSDFTLLSPWLNALIDTLTFCLMARLGARLTASRWLGLGMGLLFAVNGYVLDFSTGGMESSLYMFAIVLTFVLFFENRPRLAAAAAALALLIRPDGLLLAAAVFAAWGAGLWPRCLKAAWFWQALGVFVLVVAPWYLFAWAYFGTPVPQSVLAKAVIYRVPLFSAFRGLLIQLRAVLPFSFSAVGDNETLGLQILRSLLPASLCALGTLGLLRKYPQGWVIGFYLVLFVAAFAVGNPLWFPWYQVPLTPLYQLLMVAAVAWLGHRLRPAWRQLGTAALGLAALAVLAVPQLSRLNLIPWETLQNPAFVLNSSPDRNREDDYKTLAELLKPSADRNWQVMIPEIGAFGYNYPGRVFDTSGLVSPAALKYYPLPESLHAVYTVPLAMVLNERPDIFATYDSSIVASFSTDDPAFASEYRPVAGLVSHGYFGFQRLVAYGRVDLSAEAAPLPGAVPVQVQFEHGLVSLTGYSSRPWADKTGRFWEVTLYWRAGPEPIQRELLVRVNLMAAGDVQAYQVLNYPGEALFHTPTWGPNMLLMDRYELKLPSPDAPPYTATVALFDDSSDAMLSAQAPDGSAWPGNLVSIPLK